MDGAILDKETNKGSYEIISDTEQRLRDLEIENRNLKMYAKETRTVLSIAMLILILVVGSTL